MCAGDEQKEFIIHKNVIVTSSSKFFDKALASDRQGTRERRTHLPEVENETLEVYLHWMHRSHLIVENTGGCSTSWHCVKLYILGDFLDDAVFCEAVVDLMVDRSRGSDGVYPDQAAVTLAWKNTSTDSPLRLVIKELWLAREIAQVVKSLRNKEYPPEFVLDIFAGFVSNDEAFCLGSFSGKTADVVRESCKGYVKASRPEQQT